MRHPARLIVAVLLVCASFAARPAAAQRTVAPPAGAVDAAWVDLTRAVVVTPKTSSLQERTAVRVLVEEIEKRTNVRLPVSADWPADGVAAIAIGPIATSSGWAGAGVRGLPSAQAPGAEGYRVVLNAAARRAATVLVLGADGHGRRGGSLLIS